MRNEINGCGYSFSNAGSPRLTWTCVLADCTGTNHYLIAIREEDC